MDSNTSDYLLNQTTFPAVYYQGKEDGDHIIDLGLSLRALQPEAHDPSGHGNYDMIDRQQWHNTRGVKENCGEETEGVQSKERWAYVKVNMDGVLVGRKISIFYHTCYSGLALQLEDMFGRQSVSGLQLFRDGSEFILFYQDNDEQWRTVGDIPWKEFVDRVKRLRIVRRE